jgi:hypothetical protein
LDGFRDLWIVSGSSTTSLQLAYQLQNQEYEMEEERRRRRAERESKIEEERGQRDSHHQQIEPVANGHSKKDSKSKNVKDKNGKPCVIC